MDNTSGVEASTPRTDAQKTVTNGYYIGVEFARTLERELNEARAALAECQASLTTAYMTGHHDGMASQPTANSSHEPAAYMAFGNYEGQSIALPHHAGTFENDVVRSIMAVARKEGFKGTIDTRLKELGWSIEKVYANPRPAAVESYEKLKLVYAWFVRECAAPPESGELVDAGSRQAFEAICDLLAAAPLPT